MNGLYPVPDSVLEINILKIDFFRAPTALAGGRTAKTHLKQ